MWIFWKYSKIVPYNILESLIYEACLKKNSDTVKRGNLDHFSFLTLNFEKVDQYFNSSTIFWKFLKIYRQSGCL
jgi:hypothetical protein